MPKDRLWGISRKLRELERARQKSADKSVIAKGLVADLAFSARQR